MHTNTLSLTRLLLLCGAVAGPFFLLTVLIQDYTVPAFNPRLHLLSQLSLGEWGWVQVANFVLAGVLNLLYAVGLRRRLHPGRAGTWGPLLIGAYGLGLIVVGVFRTDPANGFPPGVPAAQGDRGPLPDAGGGEGPVQRPDGAGLTLCKDGNSVRFGLCRNFDNSPTGRQTA